jgi:hypothetical protein
VSNPNDRIGKSLLKYFKPVRVAPPHYTEREITDESPQGENVVRLFDFKEPEDKYHKAKARGLSGVEVPESADEAAATSLPPPPKGPVPWLDLVLYLVGSCRKASNKVNRRTGLEKYRHALEGRGRKSAVGNIVDATPTYKN